MSLEIKRGIMCHKRMQELDKRDVGRIKEPLVDHSGEGSVDGGGLDEGGCFGGVVYIWIFFFFLLLSYISHFFFFFFFFFFLFLFLRCRIIRVLPDEGKCNRSRN